jgi:cyclophilin family peptidyl-prolyl cis-trans isomerase/HEAT repeat protein
LTRIVDKMKHLFSIAFAILFVFSINLFAQIPIATLVQIVKAEDELRWDATLENLLKHPNAKIRERAVLAVGRIGEEKSLSALESLFTTEKDDKVRTMIMFAIGEIESAKGAETILRTLQTRNESPEVLARATEAAGKIVAANPKDESAKKLGAAILERLEFEDKKRSAPFQNIVLPGLTAVLRARPEGGEKIVAEFLGYSNPRIRADALNTLARLRSKIANEKARELLAKDTDAVVRANAARLLGAAEDKEALDLLVNAATKDEDSRVRVSAIRALGGLKDASVAEKLIPSFSPVALKACLAMAKAASGYSNCDGFKSEYLEIATTLGRLLPNTENQKAIDFLQNLRQSDNYESPESEIAFTRVAPRYNSIQRLSFPKDFAILKTNFRVASSLAQGFGDIANSTNEENKRVVKDTLKNIFDYYPIHVNAVSDWLTAYAAFKPNDLNKLLFKHLNHKDPNVRATAAGLIAEQPPSKENFDALNNAFDDAFLQDKDSNDALLSIMDALFKVNQNDSLPIIFLAFSHDDFLVRKKAFELFRKVDSAYAKAMIERAISQNKHRVFPFKKGSKQGVVLNSNADYIRAVSRKNGTVKAVLTTSKGTFTINLTPEDAPLTVDNFIKLAKSNYFNGLFVHRVVPNFVMQDGDPRGDGNGGPGWSIRCEINLLEYERGAVGMALSGKDTGGSQWFVTHSPQPHLDGGYTIFGRVNEADMKVVDSIVRGDKILRVKIIGDSVLKKSKNSK